MIDRVLRLSGIRHVIDCGKVKAKSFNATSGLDLLKVQNVSKAQAWQRTGRAGRESRYDVIETKNSWTVMRCIKEFGPTQKWRIPFDPSLPYNLQWMLLPAVQRGRIQPHVREHSPWDPAMQSRCRFAPNHGHGNQRRAQIRFYEPARSRWEFRVWSGCFEYIMSFMCETSTLKLLIRLHHLAESVAKALETLRLLGAVEKSAESYSLTSLGQSMSAFPLDPKLAKVLLASKTYRCSDEVLSIVSLLTTGCDIEWSDMGVPCAMFCCNRPFVYILPNAQLTVDWTICCLFSLVGYCILWLILCPSCLQSCLNPFIELVIVWFHFVTDFVSILFTILS